MAPNDLTRLSEVLVSPERGFVPFHVSLVPVFGGRFRAADSGLACRQERQIVLSTSDLHGFLPELSPSLERMGLGPGSCPREQVPGCPAASSPALPACSPAPAGSPGRVWVTVQLTSVPFPAGLCQSHDDYRRRSAKRRRFLVVRGGLTAIIVVQMPRVDSPARGCHFHGNPSGPARAVGINRGAANE